MADTPTATHGQHPVELTQRNEQITREVEAEATLVDAIRECIVDLSDADIIELDAGNLGLAAFPEAGKVFADYGFNESKWTDRAIREYWTQAYGKGLLIGLWSSYDEEDGRSLYVLAGEPAIDEGFDNALEEKMADADWVVRVARICKEQMLSEQALRRAIDSVIDLWMNPELMYPEE